MAAIALVGCGGTYDSTVNGVVTLDGTAFTRHGIVLTTRPGILGIRND